MFEKIRRFWKKEDRKNRAKVQTEIDAFMIDYNAVCAKHGLYIVAQPSQLTLSKLPQRDPLIIQDQ